MVKQTEKLEVRHYAKCNCDHKKKTITEGRENCFSSGMWRHAFRLLAKRIAPLSARSGRSPARRVGQRRAGSSALYSLGALRTALGGNSGVRSLSPAMRKRLVELLSTSSSKAKSGKSPSAVRSSSRIHGPCLPPRGSSGSLRDRSKKRNILGSKKYSRKASSSRGRTTGRTSSKLHSAAKKLRIRRSRSLSAKRKRKGKGKILAKRSPKKVQRSHSDSVSLSSLATEKGPSTSPAAGDVQSSNTAPGGTANASASNPSHASTGIPHPGSPSPGNASFYGSPNVVPKASQWNPSQSNATGMSASFSALPASLLGNTSSSAGPNHNNSHNSKSFIPPTVDPPPRINYHLATAVATVVVPAVANEMLEGMRHVVTRASRDGASLDRTSGASAQQMEEYYMASKGPLFATAVIAGTNAVKLSSTILPLCQPVGIQKCSFTFRRRSLPQSVRPSALPHRVVLRKRATPPSSIVPKRSEYSVLYCFCTVATSEKKAGGVEMEALAGATVAATTMYDMLRQLPCSQEDGLMLGESFVLAKRGGQGDFIKLLMSESFPSSPAVLRSTVAPPSPPPIHAAPPPAGPASSRPPSFSPLYSAPPSPVASSSAAPQKPEESRTLQSVAESPGSLPSSQKEHTEREFDVIKAPRVEPNWQQVEAKNDEKNGVKAVVETEEGEENGEGKEEDEEEVEVEEDEEDLEQTFTEGNETRVGKKISVSSNEKPASEPVSSAPSSSSLPRDTLASVPMDPTKGPTSSTASYLSSSINKKARAPAPPVDTSALPAPVSPLLRAELPVTRPMASSGDVVSWWQSTPQERRLQEYNPRRRYGEGRLSPITLADKKIPRGKEKIEKEEEKVEETVVSSPSLPTLQTSSLTGKRLKRKKVVKIIRKSHRTAPSPHIPEYTHDKKGQEGRMEEDEKSVAALLMDEGNEEIHGQEENVTKRNENTDEKHQKRKKKRSEEEGEGKTVSSLIKKKASLEQGKESEAEDEQEEEMEDRRGTKGSTAGSRRSRESREKDNESSNHRSEVRKDEEEFFSSDGEEEYSPVDHSDWDTLTTRVEDEIEVEKEETKEKHKKYEEPENNKISSASERYSRKFPLDSESRSNFSRNENDVEDDDYMLPPPREKFSSLLKKKRKKIRHQ